MKRSHPSRNRETRKLFLASSGKVLLSLLLLLSLIAAGGCSQEDPFKKKLNIGGDFTLTDYDNHPFHLKDMRGKVVLLYFGYTLCPDACPFTLSKIKRVFKEMGESKAKKIQTIFITVDPSRDSKEKLKSYLGYYDVNAIGLTGSEEEIASVAKLYGVKYRKAESDSAAGYLMDHSTYTYLIDQSGKVRYRFRHKDSPRLMRSVIELLVP